MASTSAGDTWPAITRTTWPSRPTASICSLLSSGQAEGDAKKPLPALEIVAVDLKAESGRTVGRITFRRDRRSLPAVAVGIRARCAAVLLTKTNQTLAIDLSVPESPQADRADQADGFRRSLRLLFPGFRLDHDAGCVAIRGHRDPGAGGGQTGKCCRSNRSAPPRRLPGLHRHRDSVLELFQTEPRQSLGRLPLKGPLNLGRTRPTGLAYSRERGLLAVATRSGTIHMVEMVPRTLSVVSGQGPIAASGGRRDVNRR